MRSKLTAMVVLWALVVALPVGPAAAATVFSDTFETGSLAAWTSVGTGGDGTAGVQSEMVRNGSYAMRLSAGATAGSFAYTRKTFSSNQTELTVRAGFRLLAEGASGGSVPFFRLYDAGGTRLVNLYRQNQSANKVYVQHSGAYTLTSARLPLDTWGQLELRVVVAGASASTVELKLDGALAYQTSTASLGTAGVATLQVGNDTKGQGFTLVADDVAATNASTDTTPPETAIDSGPSGTVQTGSASFAFSSEPGSSFECSLDTSAWSACASPRAYSSLTDGAHSFRVRATDSAGNTDPSPAERTWTVAVPGTCDPSIPDPSTGDPGTVVVADNFEGGSLSSWTKVTAQGDATVAAQGENVHSGRCAVRLHVTTKVWDSRANLTKTLPTGTSEVWADGWFNVEGEGVDTTWNTPTFRLLSNGKRVLDASRQNGNGNFFVRYPNGSGGWSYVQTGRRLDLRRWYRIKLHAVASGNLSTVEVWLDGAKVLSSTSATLGVLQFDVAMIGAEHQNQEGDVVADDVVVKASGTPTSDLFRDGFESGNLRAWSSVQVGGDGVATAQASVVKTGSQAGQLAATANSGSYAYARSSFAAAQTDLTVSADLRVTAEGAAAGTVPLLNLYDAGGARLLTLFRHNQSGDRLSVQDTSRTTATTGALPLNTWGSFRVRTITRGNAVSTVEVRLNDIQIYRTDTASLGLTGVKSLQIGNTAPGKAFGLIADNVLAAKGAEGPANDPRHKLLIADNLNRRLLITDLDGQVVWKFDNPTGNSEYTAGPIGVRWLPDNQILATFGTGEVGVIDVATKTWVWRTKGYNGDWFQSPYDAELLPDGNLAVALRFNDGGRVSVYNRATGAEVWRHLLGDAHAIHFRTAAQSYNSDDPTLLVGGFGSVREVAYRVNGGRNVTWEVRTEYSHDAVVLQDDTLLTTEGYYIQKIDRLGTQLWRKSTPEEDRRIAINPNPAGGYIVTVAEGDRVEFRDGNGNLLRDWSMLSDGTGLDFPYGIQVIQYNG